MSNINTALRASAWVAIAAILMLATFEPIAVEPPIQVAASPTFQAAA